VVKRGLLTFCLLAAAPVAGAQAIPWAESLAAAKQEAKQSGRPVLIHESYDDCSGCRHYAQVVYPAAAVQALAPRFVWLRLAPPKPGEEPPKLPGPDLVDHPLVRFVKADWKDEIYHFTVPFVKPEAFAGIMERVLSIAEAEAATERNSRDVEAWYALGAAYFGFDPPDYARALNPCQQVVKLDPQDKTGHLEEARLEAALALLQTDTGARKKAVQLLGEFVQAYPGSKRLSEALYYQAAGMAASGDVAGAQKVLRTIRDLEPEGSEWADRADELATRLQIAVWREKLPLAGAAPDLPPPAYVPEQVELLFQLGHACTKVRYYNWAMQYLEQYLRYDPGNELGHLDDANLDVAISIVLSAPQMAVLRLKQYLREHTTTPRMDELLLALGTAYFALADANSARGLCQQVIARYPKTRAARAAGRLLDEVEAMGARGGPGGPGLPDWLRGTPVLPP